MNTEYRNGLTAVSVSDFERVEIVQLGGLTMDQYYAKHKPDIMINASLWDRKGAIGTIWQDGKLVRNEGTGFGFGITPAGAWGFGDPWGSWQNYITGHPALVQDGKMLNYSVSKDIMTSSTKRSVLAAAGNKLYFITADRMTIAQLRSALINFGAYHAINLDGGGSSRLMVNGKAINNPTDNRKCPNAIAVWLKKESNNNLSKVFLGVGHGGVDSGATSDGYREKDITLVMAQACRDELVRHGVEVRMSRTTDVTNPLSEVVRQCNAYSPNLAVDIHVNAGGGDGFEAYHTLSGGKGKILAQDIESEVKKLGQNSRGCKTRANSAGKDYYGFVRQTACPAVIVEIGFIDNATDRAAFNTKEKQIAYGKAYARGILKTLGIKVATTEVSEIDRLAKIVKEKYGFEDNTMKYLLDYQYAEALLDRLSK